MKIIWSPTARNKAKGILEYISEDNPDAALALIDLIEEKVEKLRQNPESGRVFPPTKNDKILELVVHDNYGVIYAINDSDYFCPKRFTKVNENTVNLQCSRTLSDSGIGATDLSASCEIIVTHAQFKNSVIPLSIPLWHTAVSFLYSFVS